MDILNKLGIISFLLTMLALWLLGENIVYGWLVFLPSYALQMYIFFRTKQAFLIAQMCVLFAFSVVNFLNLEG